MPPIIYFSLRDKHAIAAAMLPPPTTPRQPAVFAMPPPMPHYVPPSRGGSLMPPPYQLRQRDARAMRCAAFEGRGFTAATIALSRFHASGQAAASV